jgi:hypothetical protein
MGCLVGTDAGRKIIQSGDKMASATNVTASHDTMKKPPSLSVDELRDLASHFREVAKRSRKIGEHFLPLSSRSGRLNLRLLSNAAGGVMVCCTCFLWNGRCWNGGDLSHPGDRYSDGWSPNFQRISRAVGEFALS